MLNLLDSMKSLKYERRSSILHDGGASVSEERAMTEAKVNELERFGYIGYEYTTRARAHVVMCPQVESDVRRDSFSSSLRCHV
jgi:hypothetical protein